ncbi:hypothetical protein MKEN_01184600 [Mycena kentingensis (nom. inval.)]|nr:hypothetical protein MKEN_01184600 [Mycena kentingensis (nom. inval.)]
MSEIIDLTHTLRASIPIYPGDPYFSCLPCTSIAGDGYAISRLALGSHSGTHIDAPAHFIQGGRTVDELRLEGELVGKAVVANVESEPAGEADNRRGREISWAELKDALTVAGFDLNARPCSPMPMLLIRTGWDRFWNSSSVDASTATYFKHPFISPTAASSIVHLGFRVVGIDALSPDETRVENSDAPDEALAFAAHTHILGADGIIAENLTNLHLLGTGAGWTVHLVPLKIGACDGSPIRAYAVKDS